MAEWQTRLVQVQVLSPEWGFNSPRRHQIFCKKLRVWHNGCAPAFQAGHGGSTPPTRSKRSGGIPERPKGADCKSAVTDFDGSNPSSTTIFDNTAPQMRCFFFVKKRSGKMDFSASAENYTAVRYIELGWFDHGSLLPGCVSNADRRSSNARQPTVSEQSHFCESQK